MEFSKEQISALDAIHKHDWSKPFFLGGYAGTGKTTVLKELAKRYEKIAFLAPTGKACQVLQSKMPDAKIRTIHSALYAADEITDKKLRELKEEADAGDTQAKSLFEYYTKPDVLRVCFSMKPWEGFATHLIVVDEASMVGQKEYDNLISVAPKIIFVGDPAQLPPVESPSILPDVFDSFLHTVHRAAMDSPITRLAMSIRDGSFKDWDRWSDEGIHILHKLDRRLLKGADQIISPMRKTKDTVNKVLRLNHEEIYPMAGDKIIVRQNVRRETGSYLVNGDIGEVERVSRNYMLAKFGYDRSPLRGFMYCDEEIARAYNATPKYPREKNTVRVDYAYGITVHSSQGSEWKNVLFVDDGMWSGRKEQRRSLVYTAVTRASENLSVYIGKRK